MFKLIGSILTVLFSLIALIFAIFIDIFRLIINLILGKPSKPVKTKIPSKETFKHKQRTYEYDKENNIWHLSEEDKRIAKAERMSYADYIEAEERDDDNLDNDD